MEEGVTGVYMCPSVSTLILCQEILRLIESCVFVSVLKSLHDKVGIKKFSPMELCYLCSESLTWLGGSST